MDKPVYYQWQNEHLCRTIYPLREIKLRDFLAFYYEIDLWSQYKNVTLEKIPEQVQAYRAERDRQWEAAFDRLEELKGYFLSEDISDQYQRAFPAPDPNVLAKINAIHAEFRRYFPGYKDPRKERFFLTGRIQALENLRKDLGLEAASKRRAIRNMGPTWKKTPEYEAAIQNLEQVSLKMVGQELDRLGAFLGAMDRVVKQRESLKKWYDRQEQEGKKLEAELLKQRWIAGRYPERAGILQIVQGLETQVRQIRERLDSERSRPLKVQARQLTQEQPVTMADILVGQVERYREELAAKDHQQLLEEVVQRFLKEPRRYPLWLQYMVVHFSGMRYKSAHGSWADPKDLLLSLQVREVQKQVQGMSDETVEATCREKVGEYTREQLQAESQEEKDQIDYLLRGIQSAYPFQRRKSLLDLLIAEENERIEELSDQQALDTLELMKDEFPEWMWKEVVARTELRLKEATSDHWEELTPEEQEQRNSREWQDFRVIINEWKKKYLTGWREEHDHTNRLIVTRAVCNEVAEHIQHVRGNSPPGGLTAKPQWYLRLEKDPRLGSGPDPAYFVKPEEKTDFKPGASLLWLRWVDRQPSPWQIALPVILKNGEGLLPPEAASASGNQLVRSQMISVEQRAQGNGKLKHGPKTIQKYQKQWLRWIHEATIAEVAETADGTVVLTFETALPYEPRLQSTIGVFKHSLGELKYSASGKFLNGTFVGYAPEGDVPYEDLEEILDWNKVLRREAVTPAEMQRYWEQVRRPRPAPFPAPFSFPIEPAAEEAAGTSPQPEQPEPGPWGWKPKNWILWSEILDFFRRAARTIGQILTGRFLYR